MESELQLLGLLGPIGWQELLIVGVVGLLIFGRKLPEVGRSLGKSIVEFKRGLADAKHEVQDATKDLPTVDDLKEVPSSDEKPAASDGAGPSTSTP